MEGFEGDEAESWEKQSASRSLQAGRRLVEKYTENQTMNWGSTGYIAEACISGVESSYSPLASGAGMIADYHRFPLPELQTQTRFLVHEDAEGREFEIYGSCRSLEACVEERKLDRSRLFVMPGSRHPHSPSCAQLSAVGGAVGQVL